MTVPKGQRHDWSHERGNFVDGVVKIARCPCGLTRRRSLLTTIRASGETVTVVSSYSDHERTGVRRGNWSKRLPRACDR